MTKEKSYLIYLLSCFLNGEMPKAKAVDWNTVYTYVCCWTHSHEEEPRFIKKTSECKRETVGAEDGNCAQRFDVCCSLYFCWTELPLSVDRASVLGVLDCFSIVFDRICVVCRSAARKHMVIQNYRSTERTESDRYWFIRYCAASDVYEHVAAFSDYAASVGFSDFLRHNATVHSHYYKTDTKRGKGLGRRLGWIHGI